MVYRILKIVNRILFGLMTLAFVVCLVYTLTAPMVQAGMEQARRSAEQVVSSATNAIQSELTRQTDEALDDARAWFDGAAQSVAGVWATFTAPDATTQGSVGSGVIPTYSGLAS